MSVAADLHQEALKKDQSPERFLKIQLELEEEQSLTEVELRFFIVSGLRSLHGEVGAALNFDVLEHDEDSNVALLRVSREGLVNLWSSLTLLGFYKDHRCAFRVLQVFSLTRTFSERDLVEFSVLTGDSNPLHLDPDFAKTTAFSRPVVHGVLVNGLISAVLGSNAPGCILLKQDIRFPAPLFLNEPVLAQIQVQRVRLSTARVSVRVQTEDQTKDPRVVLEGTVTVKIHHNERGQT